MAKLLYVEPNDEITDLVDRIRRAEGDRDLVFVVPPDGRVLRSPLDMRLLMQYTRGFQKRIAIVSGDPQIQALAIRTGFPTFASLARLEQGAPLRGVPDVAAAAAASAAAAADVAESVGRGGRAAAPLVSGEEPPPTQLAKRSPSALLAAGTGGAAGWWGRIKEMWDSQGQHKRPIAIGAVVLVVILLFLIFQSATVTLGVRAHRLADTVTIQGTDGASSGRTLDQITTQALQSQTYNKNFTVTPSGTQSLPPVPATGDLEFCLAGGGIPGQSLSFQGNAPEFQDSSSSGVGFTTTTAGEGQTLSPLPKCSSGNYSAGVAVQGDANTVGTQGNVGAGQSWTWTNAGSTECVSASPGSCDSPAPALQITNSSAMTGGTNASTQSVFSTADATAAQNQQQTIDTNLTNKAKKDLTRLAGKSVIAQDAAGNGITVTVTNPPLPTGCNTSASTPCPAATAQTLTVSVTAGASDYNRVAARAAVLQDLKSKVPSNGELLANPDLGHLKVVAAGAGGTVTITSHAVGYWAPNLDLKPLQSKLGFMGPGAAKPYLLSQLPSSSTVTITQFPFGWPWLPIFSGNIHIVRTSLAQSHTTG
ncbi:MAG TPA: hypothetical protein VMW80_08690 [Candidatus Dormibacteraeota bacterium]|nr:hypothetical protein [Candidatus Dormibacteraeota bacterium]